MEDIGHVISGVGLPYWAWENNNARSTDLKVSNFNMLLLGYKIRCERNFMQFHNHTTRVSDFTSGAKELGFHLEFLYTPEYLIN